MKKQFIYLLCAIVALRAQKANGNLIYENGQRKMLLVEGGYVSFSGTGTPSYHYYLTDHLDNNRVVLNQNGTVEQVNHYYPFGMEFNETASLSEQPYRFGGKELQHQAGLNWYDFLARQYDPALGRFTSVDPMCEKYYSASPYAYCGNNPMRFVDPTGMYTIDPELAKQYSQFDEYLKRISEEWTKKMKNLKKHFKKRVL